MSTSFHLGFAIQEVIAQLQWNLRNGIGLLGSQWRYIHLWLLSSACEWDTIRMGEVLVWRGQAWLNKFTLNRSFLQSQETTSGIHANTESCDSLLNSYWLVQNSEHQGPTGYQLSGCRALLSYVLVSPFSRDHDKENFPKGWHVAARPWDWQPVGSSMT